MEPSPSPPTADRALLQRLARGARHRYRAIFLLTGLVLAGAVTLASRLRFDTDVLNLLPRRAPEVQAFREALDRFGSADYLIVAVRIPEGAVLDPYLSLADRLGAGLDRSLLIDEVEYRLAEIEGLLEAFLPRSMLFLDEGARAAVVERLSDEGLRRRVRELRRLVETPQSVALKSVLRLDPVGLAEVFLERFTGARAGLSVDWTTGYLLSTDRRMLLLLAQPTAPPQNVDFAKRLSAETAALIEEVRTAWPEIAGPDAGPAPEVALGGRYVIAVGDEELIRRDAITNVLTSMAGVLALFLLAFRRFGLLLYAFVPLCSGLALTFGFSAVVYGSLSAATSGVAALLIGLGIDFVIVSYGRYVEERRGGAGLETALARMSGSSGRAVVVGGVTSAATFYSFGVTDFTGLRQMGFLTGTGILFCMLAVLLLLPAMLAWSEDHHRRRDRAPRLVLHGLGSARLIRLALARPTWVLLASLVVSAAAVAALPRLEFVDSVQAMRPAGNPGVTVRDEVAERFASGFDQMMLVVGGDTVDEVVEGAHRAAEGARALVASGVLVAADAVTTLIPPPARQRAALEWLSRARVAELDPDRIRSTFAEAAAAEGLRLDPFLPGLDLLTQAIERQRPVGPDDYASSPQTRALLDRYLARSPGGWQSAVFLYPPAMRWRREPPPEVERLAAELGPHAVLTGANVVSKFLRRRVLEDAVVAAVLGFVLVAALLWLDYRRLDDTLLSLAPLTMGIIWMLGALALLGWPMNFMNIFVTTMIIGIGVDYGVHMIHRYRERAAADPAARAAGLAETGKAIVLAALSTIVGFGSLSFSHYPGLQSMGRVAILGAVTTALVAITVLPAYLARFRLPRTPQPGE